MKFAYGDPLCVICYIGFGEINSYCVDTPRDWESSLKLDLTLILTHGSAQASAMQRLAWAVATAVPALISVVPSLLMLPLFILEHLSIGGAGKPPLGALAADVVTGLLFWHRCGPGAGTPGCLAGLQRSALHMGERCSAACTHLSAQHQHRSTDAIFHCTQEPLHAILDYYHT